MTQRAGNSCSIIAIFALAFLVPAWPWLSGAVTVPYDAKSTFLPPVEFMAHAFASGRVAVLDAERLSRAGRTSPTRSRCWPRRCMCCSRLSAPRRDFAPIDAVTFAYLFLGGLGIILYFRDRGWHAAGALVAALAFAFGGAASARLQHTGQVISLAYLPIALWLPVARARSRIRGARVRSPASRVR